MSKPRQQRRRCLHIREKKGIGAKNGIETPPTPEKNRGADWKKDLQTCCKGRKSRKRPTLVVGTKPNGKSRLKLFQRIQYNRPREKTHANRSQMPFPPRCRRRHVEPRLVAEPVEG